MAEKTKQSEALTKIGKLFEQKRKALGKQYKSREQFILTNCLAQKIGFRFDTYAI